MSPDLERLPAVIEDLAPPHLVAAYLFGSHAEARAHRESDLDVGVVFRHAGLPAARDRFEAGVLLASGIGAALGDSRVDLVVLNDAPPGLAAAVTTTGRLLYCTDREGEHAFRRDAQLRAADLEPFLRRTRRIKLEGLGR